MVGFNIHLIEQFFDDLDGGRWALDDEGVVRVDLGVPMGQDLEGFGIVEMIVIEGLAGDLGGGFSHAIGGAERPAESEGFFEEIGLDAAATNED